MTEGERLSKLETQMDNIEEKVDDLKSMLKDFIDKSEQRFASKWVEDAIRYALYTIVGAVLVALLGLVIVNSK